jgi:spermidine synthase
MRAAPSGPTPNGVALARRGERVASWLLLLASGFAGLVYQVLWMRELGILFGNSSHATATTLAAFFLGIATGGAVFGRRAARSRRPLRAYGWLEIGVAATALLYFGLLALFHWLYAPLFAWLGEQRPAFVAAKFTLAMLVLFPPAFLMGGTLPLMSQHLVRRQHLLGATAARLYAANTLGAALGAYMSGFHLIRHLGVTRSYSLALVVTLSVGGVALWLGRRDSAAAQPAARGELSPSFSPAVVGSLAFLSGLTTLALEVLWTRMFSQVLQNSVYTFALILVTFLVSLALGAAIAGVLARREAAPGPTLTVLLLGSALCVGASPFAFWWVSDGLQYVASESGFGDYVLRVFGSAAAVLLLPTAWLGILFPYLLKVAEPWGWGAGRTVGDLAALNTLGGVAGSLLAGFLLLATLGLWDSLRVVAAAYALAALWLGLRSQRPALAALLPAGALALLLGPLDASRLPLVSVDSEGGGEKIIEVLEGSAATVAVVERPDSLRIKLNNYYGLGGSGDRRQEAREAHLPLVLHPAPRSAFFLGLGTGITAGAALQHPIEQLVVAELVPEVVTAARTHFGPWQNGLFEDGRTRVHVEDARNVLAGTRQHFDVIVGDLFLPWKAGTGSLFARELFEAGRERLAPGGIYAQWLLLIQLSEQEFGSIARTFVDVFPRATLWRGNYRVSHPLLLLVGERDPTPLDPEALQRRLDAIARLDGNEGDRGVGRNAAPISSEELLLYYQGNLSEARSLLQSYPVNSDDRPFIEYSSPVTHRRKRTGEAQAFRAGALVAFFDELFERVPPDRDPALAGLDPAQRALPAAGLDLYRSLVLRQEGDGEGAQRARARYEAARSGASGARPPAP